MEQIRKIIRKQLFELYEIESFEDISKPGEYSTEEMESFLFKLIDLIPFGVENYGSGPTIDIPSSWPASSISYTKDDVIKAWEEAKRNYVNPVKWYVWKANIGGLNKPIYLSAQRIDINSILNIVSRFPESFRSMSIGLTEKDVNRIIDTKGD